MQLVAALQNLSVRSDGRGFVPAKNHEERGTNRINGSALGVGGFDASNLIYRRTAPSTRYREGETTRVELRRGQAARRQLARSPRMRR